ncbi:2-isopropylmalate synthase [Xenorhabdus vietnamensis]|uniref:2-isopropylmalate synthase n=1 Tax=Xenorhabdus vietnamensis TaxID=351656 RepID=A0A1Y2S7D7_9GAMM|nr:2-isopropylmalate synthase [Xenorhabdus vietnamensis]OTA14572.1 2-isopropylmalate synthase [Xenorhabdus vietnamensis]
MALFNHKKYKTFTPPSNPNRKWPNKTIKEPPIFGSVDLRDGNQALKNPLNVEQKLEYFNLLLKIGFKEIEIGFPAASKDDYNFARTLVEKKYIPDDVVIQVITQAKEELIERTFSALKGAKKAIIQIYHSTSKIQREKVYNYSVPTLINLAKDAAKKIVDLSKNYPETEWTFAYGLESFSATETDVSIAICNAVTEVWLQNANQKVMINLPTTLEMATPNVFADQVEIFINNINKRENVIISVHTHNDRGTAVAAAELACLAGADRVEGTLLGIGERAGNMDIITMAMNLYSQGIDPYLDLSNIMDTTKFVEKHTENITHPRHPYIGELVYSAFSGGHQYSIQKYLNDYKFGDIWECPYLSIDPQDLGRSYDEVIRINSQSGKSGIKFILEEKYGLILPKWLQANFYRIVQNYTEKTEAEISEELIWSLFYDQYIKSKMSEEIKAFFASYDTRYQRLQLALNDSLNSDNELNHLDEITPKFKEIFYEDFEIISMFSHHIGKNHENKYICYLKILCEGTQHYTAAISNTLKKAELFAIENAILSHLSLKIGLEYDKYCEMNNEQIVSH